MLPFKIGNWLITEDAICWDGLEKHEYEITRERITEKGPSPRNKMYDWLVHMPTKTWLKREDIYSLNTALIYAMEVYKIPFETELSFVETFIEQEHQLKQKK